MRKPFERVADRQELCYRIVDGRKCTRRGVWRKQSEYGSFYLYFCTQHKRIVERDLTSGSPA